MDSRPDRQEPHEPPRLHSLTARGLRFAAPPRPLTTLVGRDDDAARVAALLRRDEVQFVTLTGTGGVGKTRLALRVADELDDDFEDGVAFAALASVVDPDDVLPEVGRVLGVSADAPGEAAERLARALESRRLLLLLDNMEQVRPAGAALGELLAACPDLRLLVTSRAPLRVSGEHVVRVAPLALPDLDAPPAPEQLAETEAVALFVQRAQAANAAFALTADNAAVIAAICHRLDGLPLAIELAAARLDVLSPRALLAQLDHRLTLLTAGPCDAPARHRTLRGTIAWSYDLLGPDEQRLYGRLSVFAGSFSLKGTEAVSDEGSRVSRTRPEGHLPTPADRHPDPAVLDRVSALVEHSLLQRAAEDEVDGEPRFAMLETIREDALDRLEQSGDVEETRRRHAEFFRMLAADAEPHLTSPMQRLWLDRLERDAPNLRAALAWAIESGDADLTLDLAADLLMFWLKRGHVAEGRVWLGRALDLAGDDPTPRRLKALIAMGFLSGPAGDAARANASVALARQLGDDLSVGKALLLLGNPALFADPRQAIEILEQSLAVLGEVQDHVWQSLALMGIGMTAQRMGDAERAVSSHENAVALSAEHGEVWCRVLALINLASVVRGGGNTERAVNLYAESLREALGLGDGIVTSEALLGLGGVLAAANRAADAARFFGAAEAVRETVGLSLRHLMAPHVYERDLAAARRAMEPDAFAASWAAGRLIAPADLLEAAREAVTAATGSPPAPRADGPAEKLTPRELDVLRLVAEHRTDREIAAILYIGTRTVEFHVGNILGKLGAENRRQAAAIASCLGLI